METYTRIETGSHRRHYLDPVDTPTLPDLDANLRWEFRDADGTLRFTATVTSTPAITNGVDAFGPYVEVTGVALSDYAYGFVEVSAYANVGGVPVVPSPEVDTAFEVVRDATTLGELRALLRIDDDDDSEDAVLQSMIDIATDYAEQYLARTLITKDRTKQVQAPISRGLSHSFLKWPKVLLTYPPVISVDRVYTVNEQGNETTIGSSAYWLDTYQEPPELHLKSSAWSYLLRVDYSAGYGDTLLDVPESIRSGILKHAAYLYKYRGDCDAGEAATKSGAIGEYRIYKVVRRG